MMLQQRYPVRVVAAQTGTTVLMIHRRDLQKSFSTKDKEKIIEM